MKTSNNGNGHNRFDDVPIALRRGEADRQELLSSGDINEERRLISQSVPEHVDAITAHRLEISRSQGASDVYDAFNR